MTRFFLCVVIFVTIGASASVQLAISLKDLYSIAAYVGVIELTEGRAVAVAGETCGAKYVGKVVEGIRGAKVGESVEFGYVPSLKIGSKYLVLLGEYDSAQLERIPDFHDRCRKVLPRKALVGLWRGAMEVIPGADRPSERDQWTVSTVSHVIYPLGTRSKLIDGERRLVYADLVARMKDER